MYTLLISRDVAFLFIYLCIKTQTKGSKSLLQVAKTKNQQLLHVCMYNLLPSWMAYRLQCIALSPLLVIYVCNEVVLCNNCCT